MPVQFKFFIISVKNHEDAEADLNRFIRSKRVLAVHREFIQQGENSFWSMIIEYLTGADDAGSSKDGKANRKRIDYKEVLSPEDFALFVRLRDWRKQAAASEGVPVYTIFNNEQLAIIAKKRISTLSELQKIEGVGEARVKKYGETVVKVISQPNNLEVFYTRMVKRNDE
jgi:superfamily II DNA helicase RecQ